MKSSVLPSVLLLLGCLSQVLAYDTPPDLLEDNGPTQGFWSGICNKSNSTTFDTDSYLSKTDFYFGSNNFFSMTLSIYLSGSECEVLPNHSFDIAIYTFGYYSLYPAVNVTGGAVIEGGEFYDYSSVYNLDLQIVGIQSFFSSEGTYAVSTLCFNIVPTDGFTVGTVNYLSVSSICPELNLLGCETQYTYVQTTSFGDIYLPQGSCFSDARPPPAANFTGENYGYPLSLPNYFPPYILPIQQKSECNTWQTACEQVTINGRVLQTQTIYYYQDISGDYSSTVNFFLSSNCVSAPDFYIGSTASVQVETPFPYAYAPPNTFFGPSYSSVAWLNVYFENKELIVSENAVSFVESTCSISISNYKTPYIFLAGHGCSALGVSTCHEEQDIVQTTIGISPSVYYQGYRNFSTTGSCSLPNRLTQTTLSPPAYCIAYYTVIPSPTRFVLNETHPPSGSSSSGPGVIPVFEGLSFGPETKDVIIGASVAGAAGLVIFVLILVTCIKSRRNYVAYHFKSAITCRTQRYPSDPSSPALQALVVILAITRTIQIAGTLICGLFTLLPVYVVSYGYSVRFASALDIGLFFAVLGITVIEVIFLMVFGIGMYNKRIYAFPDVLCAFAMLVAGANLGVYIQGTFFTVPHYGAASVIGILFFVVYIFSAICLQSAALWQVNLDKPLNPLDLSLPTVLTNPPGVFTNAPPDTVVLPNTPQNFPMMPPPPQEQQSPPLYVNAPPSYINAPPPYIVTAPPTLPPTNFYYPQYFPPTQQQNQPVSQPYATSSPLQQQQQQQATDNSTVI